MTPEKFIGLPRNDQLYYAPTGVSKCDKPDCYFCYMMIGYKPTNHYTHKIVKPKKKVKFRCVRWTEEEDRLLLANIHNFDFISKGRTKSTTAIRKNKLRKIHGIIAKGRWG